MRCREKDIKAWFLQVELTALMWIFIPVLLFTMCHSNQACGQIAFRNATSFLPARPYIGFLSKALTDLNGDGYADLVRTNSKNKILSVLYNDKQGQFTEVFSQQLGVEPISTTVGDINKDGLNDFLTGGFNDGITLWRNQGNAGFKNDTVQQPVIWMQGANLVDINNDGWPDYFACNDVGLNQVWKNNTSGSFQPISNWIDFRTVPASDNSGTYGSVWSDIDNDGDLDLYLAKCSMNAMGAANAGDPRRINQLFINHTYDRINGQIIKNAKNFSLDPTGWFTEEAAAYNLKISGQSWTADFADIDNDGDQDLLVTNHELPTMLLENDGSGHFTNITDMSGLSGVVEPLQGLMRDFDNDGYVDILISGDMPAQLWRNNGNKTFTKLEPFGNIKTTSFAIGDVNRDGFLDVYVSHYPKADAEDELWLNEGNTHHYLTVTLQGIVSNSNGIGAKIIIFQNNGSKQVREVRAGESYGISNDLSQSFGLGSSSELARIEVQWPSGLQTVLNAPAVDGLLTITEPICNNPLCIPIQAKIIKQ